jgi:hypothetical protein
MLPMFLAMACSFSVLQDKPPAKTVEERLKELEVKLTTLENRNRSLEEENQALEKRISDGKAAREAFVKQSAAGWVHRYAKPVELTEKQSAELEELWIGGTRADLDRPPDGAGWKSREETINRSSHLDSCRSSPVPVGTIRKVWRSCPSRASCRW